MNKNNFYISSLFCTECEMEMKIPRPKGFKRGKGHIKHMYCANCKEVTAFEEVPEQDSSIEFWEKFQEENA